MKLETFLSGLKKHWFFLVYIVLAFFYLGVFMNIGLSWLDPGMYLSGYRWFNEDPWSCYYLGQWFLTYKVTGLLLGLFDDYSFYALRVMSLVLNLSLQTAIYLYLSRFLDRFSVVLGLGMATLACFGAYTDIGYNDYSVALLSLAIMACHAGMFCRRGLWLIFLSGVLVGVAVFFRLANVTFIVLPLLAAALARPSGSGVGAGRLLLAAFGGVVAGCAAVVLWAVADGSAPVLAQTVADLADIGGNASDPHSFKNVAIGAYTVWKGYLAGFAPIVLLIAMMILTVDRLIGVYRFVVFVALMVAVLVFVYLREPPGNIAGGISLTAMAIVAFRGKEWGRDECMLALALLVPLVFPIGSNGGIEFVGQYIGCLPVAVAIAIMSQMLPTDVRWGHPWLLGSTCGVFSIAVGLLFANLNRPMMEDGTKVDCHVSWLVEPALTDIYTTRDNVWLYNYIRENTWLRLPPDSYLVCNFSLPMLSALNCRPYGVFSDVFTSDLMNSRYIDVAYRRAGGGGHLPYMLFDRRSMTDGFRHVERELRSRSVYNVVWTDGRYELLAPCDEESAKWQMQIDL